MSKSLKAQVILPVEIGNLYYTFIENEYFSDKDDTTRLTLDRSDIPKLHELLSLTSDADEIMDFQDLIGSIEKYGSVDIWLGY